MTRGQNSQVGETRVAANGYHYTRTEKGWILTHRLLMEEHLGRPLARDESVTFYDGDKTNLTLGNLRLRKKKPKSKASRAAIIFSKINELIDEANALGDEQYALTKIK